MKLFIWGTGILVGKIVDVYINSADVTAYVDNDTSKKEWLGKKVISPEKLLITDYDAVIVANMYTQEIIKQCNSLGIDLKKFIFPYNNLETNDLNNDYSFVRKVVGKDFAKTIKNRYKLIREPKTKEKLCFSTENWNMGYFSEDFVRMKSLELVIKEIKKRNLHGSIAEVGVFRGEFAQFINMAFPTSKFYLCDTFAGFDIQEAEDEIKEKRTTQGFVDAYNSTSIATVMNKMKYKENIILKKGFFPNTMKDIDDKFSFVSIDMDFKESIIEGLKYFFPRLIKGGYIFLHDYNNSDLTGVEEAVDEYEKANNIMLCKFPLCDASGTLIITK